MLGLIAKIHGAAFEERTEGFEARAEGRATLDKLVDQRRRGRGGVMASAERKEKISNLIDQIHAALLNAKKEWHEKGETEALRTFVDILGLVVMALANVLEEVTPRLRQAATMNEIEANQLSTIAERITSLHQELDALIRELQKLVTRHTP